MFDYDKRFERETKECEKDGHTPCCKWCGECTIRDDENGTCYNDIVEWVNINEDICCAFYYDTDLDRC